MSESDKDFGSGVTRRSLVAAGAAGMVATQGARALGSWGRGTGSLPGDAITVMTAAELSVAIAERCVSCLEVMDAYLARIERLNPTYNAIVSLADGDNLRLQAAQADRELARGEYRGWMHGMPHAVKDLADLKGFINSVGSPIFKDHSLGQRFVVRGTYPGRRRHIHR